MSIEMAKKSSNPAIAYKSYILIADNYTNVDSIQKYYSLANQITENNEQLQYEKAILLTNQALLDESIGKKKNSKTNYIQAIKLGEEKGYQKLLAITYNNYAYLLMDEGNYDSALIALENAVEKAKITNQIGIEATAYDSYADYYTAINDFKKAFEYKNLSIKTKEKYIENQRIQESLFLATVFETKKKEEEILASENKLNQFRSILFGSLALIAVLLTIIIYFSQKSALTVAKLEAVEKGKSLEIANALLEGTDNERKRLAMDLHDGLGAQLGSLKFMVDTYIEDSPNYQKITNSIDDICQNVRGLSHRMLPTQLEKLGLVPTIQNLAHSISQSSGFNVDIELEIEGRLEPKLEINLYYLIFELINNAIKHSKGDSLFIQLLSHEDGLNLSVEDNGEGFNVKESKDGLGLQNIRHRVEYLGGKLIIDSKIGQGTLFMIEVPTT
jgi:signal transduction histidine kinase